MSSATTTGASSSRTATCTTTAGTASASASSSRVPRPTKKPTLPVKPSKSYEVCRFFNTERGCFSGDKCRFLHDKDEPPLEQKKVCRYFAQGYCLRGESCWFKHVTEGEPETDSKKKEKAPVEAEDDEEGDEGEREPCGICFDVPTVYGLLDGCSHIFCLQCIRMWRGGSKDACTHHGQNHRQCPGCRQATLRFITPSSQFYAEGDPRKGEVKKAYRSSMSKIPCKFFQESSPTNRLCPFGKDCYYLHENSDGTKYQFKHGATESRRIWKRQQHRPRGWAQTLPPRPRMVGDRSIAPRDLWDYLFDDIEAHGMFEWSDDDDEVEDDDLYDLVDWGVRPTNHRHERHEQLSESLDNLFYLLQ